MLYKTKDSVSGKVLYRSKPLLLRAKDTYTRPPQGKAWFMTTTTVWRVDEVIRRSVRDWRRLTNETGHTGTRAQTMRADHDSVYTSTHSSFAAPLVEWILLRYGGAPGGCILDAFAGGPPRAVVSSIMGYSYSGFEIRQDQINENQAILNDLGLDGCQYILGDGRFLEADFPQKFDAALTCHPADTKIRTVDGIKPISLVAKDDAVVTHLGRQKMVSDKIVRSYTGQLYSFKRDYNDIALKTTAEHPLLVKRGGFLMWLRADKIQLGDELLEPVQHEPQAKAINGRLIWEYQYPTRLRRIRLKGRTRVYATKDTMTLLGYYLSEGNTSGRSVVFSFNSAETALHKEVTTAFRRTFFGSASLKVTRQSTHCVVGYSLAAEQFFSAQCGKGAPNKKFPNWVWKCTNDYLVELLKALWKGDGWLELNSSSRLGHTRLGYATVSEQLADDLRRLLIRLGVVPSLRIRAPRTKGLFCDGKYRAFKSTLPQYNLTVRGMYADKLAALLGVDIKRSATKRRPSRSPKISDGYVHYPIRMIGKNLVEGLPVFNLEVEDDHSYIADGVCSHNCPPYYDLEQYSDLDTDLSNAGSYAEFNASMAICAQSHRQHMKPGSFVCIVVGPFRDKKTGELIDFPAHTVENFREAGFIYWQQIVLSKNFASAAQRSTTSWRNFKLVPAHEFLLIFRTPGGGSNVVEQKRPRAFLGKGTGAGSE